MTENSDLTALIAFCGRKRERESESSSGARDLHARHAYRKYGLMNCIRLGGALPSDLSPIKARLYLAGNGNP